MDAPLVTSQPGRAPGCASLGLAGPRRTGRGSVIAAVKAGPCREHSPSRYWHYRVARYMPRLPRPFPTTHSPRISGLAALSFNNKAHVLCLEEFVLKTAGISGILKTQQDNQFDHHCRTAPHLRNQLEKSNALSEKLRTNGTISTPPFIYLLKSAII